MQELEPDALARIVAETVVEHHATDTCIIDMRTVASYTDFFVICTGSNARLTKSIADRTARELRSDGLGGPRRRESDAGGNWLLMDYGDVVLHVFTPDARDFYRLESLWGQLPQQQIADNPGPEAASEAAAG